MSLAFAISTAVSQAAPILGVTATTLGPTLANADPIGKTADLSNLSGNTFSDVTVPSNGWYLDGSLATLPVVIDYDLHNFFLLSRLGLWNVVSNGLGFNVFGFRDVLVETSMDGTNYNPLTGAAFTAGVHTFAQAADNFGTLPEIVVFNPVVASFVRFTVQSNYNGDDFAAYNTVMFDGLAVSVPEVNHSTSRLPFCFLACLCLAASNGRRRVPQN